MKFILNFGTRYFFVLPLIFLLVYLIIKTFGLPIGDFGNYYYGSKFMIDGIWGLWIYDPASFNLKIFELGQRDFYLNYTPVPPFSSVFYVPFAYFNPVIAKLLWNLINGLLLIFTLVRFKNESDLKPIFWAIIPIIFFIPIRNTIIEGQSYFLILFLLSEGFYQYQKGNRWLMAILWALAIQLKISPAFVIFFLIFNKDNKAFLALIAINIGLVIVSMPFVGLNVWTQYVFEILPRLFDGEINQTYAINYQSVQVFLKTIFVPDQLHNTEAWFNNPAMYLRVLLIFKLIIFSSCVLASFSNISNQIKFSIWLVFSMLVSGYGNSFSLLFLIIPSIYFYPLLKEDKLLLALFFVCLILSIFIPIYKFSELSIPFRFPRLYALLALFFIMIFSSKVKMKWYFIFAILLGLFLPIKHKSFNQDYVFKTEKALLTYDFLVKDNQLELSSFDFNGPFVNQAKMDFEIRTSKLIQDTILNEFKREKSYIINDSLLIYLSDENRGVGFYTIKQKELN
jgi:hypothetical protein